MSEQGKDILLPSAMASEAVGANLWAIRVFLENGYILNYPQQLALHDIAKMALEHIDGDQDWYQLIKDLQATQGRLIRSEDMSPEVAQRIAKIGTLLRQIREGARGDDLYERAMVVLQ